MTWTVYRALWWFTVVAVSVPAIGLVLVESPVPIVVIGATLVGIRLGLSVAGARITGRVWAEAATGAALLVTAGPALAALTLPLVILACASSTPVMKLLLAPAGSDVVTWTDEPNVTPEVDAGSCLGAMSGAELCNMWTRSFVLVKSAVDVSQRAVGASVRGSVLDELERRDSALLAAWLARGPSPASEPTWVTLNKPPFPS
jgi:hypothetical protein